MLQSDFLRKLGELRIPMHYDLSELEEDLLLLNLDGRFQPHCARKAIPLAFACPTAPLAAQPPWTAETASPLFAHGKAASAMPPDNVE